MLKKKSVLPKRKASCISLKGFEWLKIEPQPVASFIVHKSSGLSLVEYWKNHPEVWFDHHIIKKNEYILEPITDDSIVSFVNVELEFVLRYDQLYRHKCSESEAENYRQQYKSEAYRAAEKSVDVLLQVLETDLEPWAQVFCLLVLRHSDDIETKMKSLNILKKLMNLDFDSEESNKFIDSFPPVLIRFLNATLMDVYQTRDKLGISYDIYTPNKKIIEDDYFNKFKPNLDPESLEKLTSIKSPLNFDLTNLIKSKKENDSKRIITGLAYGSFVSDQKLMKELVNKIEQEFHILEQQRRDDDNIILSVSLSGGLDSMLLSYIASLVVHKHNNNNNILSKWGVQLIHINYNNRLENDTECDFLKSWADFLQLPLCIRKIIEIRRTRNKETRAVYENVTRCIRFNAYKYFNSPVMLGHNLDDCIENIITNTAKKQHYSNLKGMSSRKIENDVVILRPFLDFTKYQLKTIAEIIGIPYLVDSTPEWSNRGQIRDRLMPFLHEFDNSLLTGLVLVSERLEFLEEQTAHQIKTWIHQHVVISECKSLVTDKNDKVVLCLPRDTFLETNSGCIQFWRTIWTEHDYLQSYQPSHKSLTNFINRFSKKDEDVKKKNVTKKDTKSLHLSKTCEIKWNNTQIEIIQTIETKNQDGIDKKKTDDIVLIESMNEPTD